ncbi:M1 family metallopeptidase [Silvibacterium sp.]|uniref:M1 family metallopeptidase n=1 Tax=Silvibacterium sp. TaxID=1964179 RepID=UPI0039E72400
MSLRALLASFLVLGSSAFARAQNAPANAPSAAASSGQTAAMPPAKPRKSEGPPAPVTRADILRGMYGPYRANNDLISYHLDIRVDPDKQTVSGKNTITFRMLSDGNRIQLDLHQAMNVDKILLGTTELKYERDSGAVFIDFPETLHQGATYSIDFYYSGHPLKTGRFGGFVFDKDPTGKPWIYTSCEDEGASLWWPNKDQWRDEVENMEISVAVPNNLVDISNGRMLGHKDLGDGYTRWDWVVHYPINNYDVALNIGDYQHFGERLGGLTLDFYALPGDLEKAQKQFAQSGEMLNAYAHYFGPYPFIEDGYKLIEVPYSGMEHQSAVAYGNHFENGYLGKDWTGVGISPKFDFIIIHESGHEWFGNAVSAADRSDMWIHEGWTTYLEALYVEYRWGRDDAIRYINGMKPKIFNERPIITERGVNGNPTEDQYFKGALMLNTLRSVVDNDDKWWPLLYNFFQEFKYHNIMTEDVVTYFNHETGMNLTPIFNQYLRHADIPTLELFFDPSQGTVSYKWRVDEADFAMPILVGEKGKWQRITPTEQWQTMKTSLTKDQFDVATDLFYVNVAKY